MSIQSDDKELFKKLRKIRNKIIELIGINNAKDFVKNTMYDADEFIMVGIQALLKVKIQALLKVVIVMNL